MANYLTWLGHSTFRIETSEGKVILIDPWIKENPLCPESEKKQKQVDVLLCTHGHFDHIADAVSVCLEHQPTVVGIFELALWMGGKGAKNVSPMNKGGTQEVGGVKVTMVHAVHSCGIQEEDGSIVYGGEACGYVVELGDGIKLYTAHEHWLVCPMHVLWRHGRELCTGRQCLRCSPPPTRR